MPLMHTGVAIRISQDRAFPTRSTVPGEDIRRSIYLFDTIGAARGLTQQREQQQHLPPALIYMLIESFQTHIRALLRSKMLLLQRHYSNMHNNYTILQQAHRKLYTSNLSLRQG